MPFPDINLDDRRFEDLFNEAKRRIPAYAPEWTDHNESDPGITLLQLFAWLQEMVIWRLNRVPEKNYLKFLNMIGITPRLPSAASADLTFKLSLKDPSGLVPVPKGTRVQLAQAADTGPVIFETDEDLNATPVELVAIQSFDSAQFTLISPDTLGPSKSFLPFGADPQPKAALYLGFSGAFKPGANFKIRIYTTAPEAAAMKAEMGQTDLLPVSGVWEYYIGNSRWQALPGVTDTTLALSRAGYVEFRAPGLADQPGDTAPVAAQVGALVKPEDKPLVWFRFRIAQILGSGYERTPALEQVLINTVPATNAVTEEFELLGASNGRPNQKLRLAHTQILANDPGVPGIIEVLETMEDGWVLWHEVTNFDRSARNSNHNVLYHSM
jgi:predicted phage baseplate assembly protein